MAVGECSSGLETTTAACMAVCECSSGLETTTAACMAVGEYSSGFFVNLLAGSKSCKAEFFTDTKV